MVAGPPGFHFLEDRERAIGQRNAMLARRLRAGRRDRPDFASEVDFVPTGGQRLARSRRRQNAKFESARRRRWMFTEARGESRNLTVGHGRKMAPHQLGALRQQLVEMAAPARRVGFVASDEAARALAASKICSMRPLRREAVSGAR